MNHFDRIAIKYDCIWIMKTSFIAELSEEEMVRHFVDQFEQRFKDGENPPFMIGSLEEIFDISIGLPAADVSFVNLYLALLVTI